MEKLIESETRSSLHFTPPDSSVSGRMDGERAQGSPVPRSHLLHSSRVNIYLQLHATLWRRACSTKALFAEIKSAIVPMLVAARAKGLLAVAARPSDLSLINTQPYA
jgi:hypothetical protein